MRLISTAILALCILPTLHAQTVQKCRARDGSTRYQSSPCDRGSRTVEVWDATPDIVAAPARTNAAVPHARARARSRPYTPRRRARAYAEAAPDACEQARAYRDEMERRAGLSRDYELLSALQRRVYDACR